MKKRLGNYVHIKTGRLDANAATDDGNYPFFTCAVKPLSISTYSYDCECVLVAGNGDLNVKYYDGKFDAYQRTYIIESRDKSILSVQYLYYFLTKYVETLRELSIGGVIKYIKLGNLIDAMLPIPPLTEQERIVCILKTISSLIDKKKKHLDKLNQLASSRFIEMFDFQSHLVPLNHYIDSLQAGKSLAGTQKCKNKVLKTGAVTYDYFDPTQVKYLPVDYVPDSDHKVEDGDVIISRMNTAELVGAAAYVWHAPQNTFLPDRLWKAVVKHNVNPIFLWQLLIQPSIKKTIRNIAGGTSGSMKNISKERLLKIQVPDVDYTLQNEFAAFIEELDKSKVTIQKSLDRLNLLYKALLQEYFG